MLKARPAAIMLRWAAAGNCNSYVGSTVGGSNLNIASGFWAIVGGGR